MTNRKLLLTATLFSTALAAALPAAAAHVDLFVDVAPPAPVYEPAPLPRVGYVWAPGHYDWRHGHYVWVGGHWMRERRGYVYMPGAWVMREGRYVWNEPRWEHEHHAAYHDRDHDGVPDRYDRAPDNPYRR
jgi:hypothetical protein